VKTIKRRMPAYNPGYEIPAYLHIAKIRTGDKLEEFIFSDNKRRVSRRVIIHKWRLQHTKLFEPVLEIEQRELPLAS
jgi:hypothetical protein